MLKEITHFFSIYKDLEGKRVEVKGWQDASFARAKVLDAQQALTSITRPIRSCAAK